MRKRLGEKANILSFRVSPRNELFWRISSFITYLQLATTPPRISIRELLERLVNDEKEIRQTN